MWQVMNEGRIERRTAMGFVAYIEKVSGSLASETVWIENLSERGARVLARQARPADDRLILSSPKHGFRPIIARVVYCQPFPNGVVAIGLEFDGTTQDSISSDSANISPHRFDRQLKREEPRIGANNEPSI
jgi:hypothetical protein